VNSKNQKEKNLRNLRRETKNAGNHPAFLEPKQPIV
jgi:hypothetical protein